MQSALTLKATVQAGGRIEIADAQLHDGCNVDVIVLFSQNGNGPSHSIMDVLDQAPGHLAFQTAEEVDAHLREERDAWERFPA